MVLAFNKGTMELNENMKYIKNPFILYMIRKILVSYEIDIFRASTCLKKKIPTPLLG